MLSISPDDCQFHLMIDVSATDNLSITPCSWHNVSIWNVHLSDCEMINDTEPIKYILFNMTNQWKDWNDNEGTFNLTNYLQERLGCADNSIHEAGTFWDNDYVDMSLWTSSTHYLGIHVLSIST